MRIERFKDGFGFLSNFHSHPVTFEGTSWPTSEHAYQAAKTLDSNERELIRAASTPGKAKRLGKKVTLRPDWEQVKVKIMYEILSNKFQDPLLKKLLLDTGNDELMEGNSHGDACWGCVWRDGRWQGTNYLGRILMRIRDELRTGKSVPHAKYENCVIPEVES